MATTRVPEVLSITDPDVADGEYECYEGFGGYFDGTVFEAPTRMDVLVLHVARCDADGNKDTEKADRYLYRLDASCRSATFLRSDTVARDHEPR